MKNKAKYSLNPPGGGRGVRRLSLVNMVKKILVKKVQNVKGGKRSNRAQSKEFKQSPWQKYLQGRGPEVWWGL